MRIAVKKGSLETIRRILEKGADIGIQNNAGDTCLHIAARYMDFDASVLLVHSIEENKHNKQHVQAIFEVKNKKQQTAYDIICAVEKEVEKNKRDIEMGTQAESSYLHSKYLSRCEKIKKCFV